METAEPGLRERKRLATRRAIQVAALRLVADNSLEALTIDDISREADVSPRTFFNYFASKEDALIGDGPIVPNVVELDEFVAAGESSDIFVGIGELLAVSGARASDDRELSTLRRSVLKHHPHLFAIRMATMRQFEESLSEVVARRLAVDDASLAGDPEALDSRARLVTLMATAAMKHAWTHWADSPGGGELSARLRQSFAEMREILTSETVPMSGQ